jgi:hypothetical protein
MKKFLYLLVLFVSYKFAFSLTITEIMYNPEGNDSGREWIEVLNNSSQIIEITSGKNGWRINDGSNHLFEENLTINPQEIFLIVQDKNLFFKDYPNFRGKIVTANFSLKNENGQIQIFDSQKKLLTQVFYQSSCGGNGNSYSIIFENNTCKENKIKGGTPGNLEVYEEKITENQSFIKENNQLFLASSTTQNNQILVQPLTATTPIQSKELNTDLGSVSLSNNYNFSMLTNVSTSVKNFNTNTIISLIISEFYPNPPGNDNGQEFVEIYNPNNEIIDLSNFILEVGNKRIQLSGKIEPEEYFVVNNKDYDFSIRNKGEELNLYFNKNKVFSISYQGKAPEGKSFSRFNDGWQFSQPTPGKVNIKLKSETKQQRSEEEKKVDSDFENKNYDNMIDINQINNLRSNNFVSKTNQIIYFVISLIVIVFLVLLVWIKL